jgi:hypothetical protein
LNNASDGSGSAGIANLLIPGIDTMKVLEAPFAIDRVSVGPIGERRALVFDRLQEHLLHELMDSLPLGFADPQAEGSWVDRSAMENFGGIEVANTGHEPLIEQGGLYGPVKLAVPLVEFLGADRQRIGP